jgi:hypothetical protein
MAENLTNLAATAPIASATTRALNATFFHQSRRDPGEWTQAIELLADLRSFWRFHSHFHRKHDGDKHRIGVDPDQCAADKPRVSVVMSGKFTPSDMFKARSHAG